MNCHEENEEDKEYVWWTSNLLMNGSRWLKNLSLALLSLKQASICDWFHLAMFVPIEFDVY
jgi:hypothetical protein